MINLLMRFYEPTNGQIEVDGKNISHFSRAEIRRNFGMVLQDTWLFEGTVADNIAYGKPDATSKKSFRQQKMLNVTTLFAHCLMVMTRSFLPMEPRISQGQQQLLTIARAILADPQIADLG